MNEKVKTECRAAIEEMVDTFLFYFNEHPKDRHEWAQTFKATFCELVDKIEKEFKDEEEDC